MNYLLGFETAMDCYRVLDSVKGLERYSLNPRGAKRSRIEYPNASSLLEEIKGNCEFGPKGFSNAGCGYGLSSEYAAKVFKVLRSRVNAGLKIDLVFPEARFRSNSPFVKSHLWAFPSNYKWAIQITSDIFLVAPEVCYLQLGKDHSDIQLMKLGFELCGSYSQSFEGDGFRNRLPLCSVLDIKKCAAKMPSNKGVPHGLKCLQYVREKSASPMETMLALMFGLGSSYGGYGLGVPEMNAAVDAPAAGKDAIDHKRYHCDLFWPNDKVAVEYNSTQFHLNERAAAWDAKRMNDLSLFGITVFTLTRIQVSDPNQLDGVARKIATLMGKRLRSTRGDLMERRYKLRKALFE